MWRRKCNGYKFIDIHCHLLPEVDDGARNIEESIEMLRIALNNGITDIICTPHFRKGKSYATPQQIHCLIEQLCELTIEKGIPVNLYPGNEMYYTQEAEEDLETHKIMTLNNTDYVLVEFQTFDTYQHIRNSLDSIRGLGFYPILAHAERYDCLVKDWKLIKELKELGIEIQLNASSVAGEIGGKLKRYTCKLLKKELVDYIATDAHRKEGRTPDIRKCAEYLYKKFDRSYVDKLLYWNAKERLLRERNVNGHNE